MTRLPLAADLGLPLPSGPRAATPPDGIYAFVAGGYVAALLTPVAMLGLLNAVGDAAARYVGFLTLVVAITAVAGWLVSRVPGLAVRLGRHPATPLLAVAAVPWFVGVFASAAVVTRLPAFAPVLAIFGAGAGIALGLLLTSMSRTRYARAWLADAETLAEWEARWPRRWRRGASVIMIVTATLGAIGFLGRFVAVLDPASILFPLFYVWPAFAGTVNPRSVTVTDVGLVTGRPLVRRLRPRSTIEGYSLTADALVVRQKGWWRPAIRCDREDVEDGDRVVRALETATNARL